MKQLRIGIIVFAVIAVICGIVWYANSYTFALIGAGIRKDDCTTMRAAYNVNGNEYRVVLSRSIDKDDAFVYLEKNNLGFWHVVYIVDNRNPDTGLLVTTGMNPTELRRFDFEKDDIFVEIETYIICHGNNAVKLIEFLPGQLPEHTAVSIWQAGSEYTIQLIHYGNLGEYQLNLYELLTASGSIEERKSQ